MTDPAETDSPRLRRQAAALETRENILAVATREFADKGLAGARIDEIAEQTNSSKRMIYYYFGGKEELYRAVLERAYVHIRAQEQAAGFEELQPDEALRAIIGHNFDYHVEHPEFVRLVMNENVHHGEHIAQIDSMKERNQSVIAQLRAILEKGRGARAVSGGDRPGRPAHHDQRAELLQCVQPPHFPAQFRRGLRRACHPRAAPRTDRAMRGGLGRQAALSAYRNGFGRALILSANLCTNSSI